MSKKKKKSENKPLVYIPSGVDPKLNFDSEKLDPPSTMYDVNEAIYYKRETMEELSRRRSRKNDN